MNEKVNYFVQINFDPPNQYITRDKHKMSTQIKLFYEQKLFNS